MIVIEFINYIFFIISFYVLRGIDKIFDLFSYIAGFDTNILTNSGKIENKGLLNNILKNLILSDSGQEPVLFKIFIYIFLVGIILGVFFVFVSIIKNVKQLQKTNFKIFGQFIFSIFGTFVILIAIFVISYSINVITSIIYSSFDTNLGTEKLSSKIFNSLIDRQLIKNETLFNQSLLNMNTSFIDEVFGTITKKWFIGFQFKGGNLHNRANLPGMFIFLITMIVSASLIIIMLKLSIRVFDLLFLIFILPLIMSTIPLDDGIRFNEWKKNVFLKLFVVLGFVISIGIYFIFLKIFDNLTYNTTNMNYSVAAMLRGFLIAAASITLPSTQGIFENIISGNGILKASKGNFLSVFNKGFKIARSSSKLIFNKNEKINNKMIKFNNSLAKKYNKNINKYNPKKYKNIFNLNKSSRINQDYTSLIDTSLSVNKFNNELTLSENLQIRESKLFLNEIKNAKENYKYQNIKNKKGIKQI